MEAIAFIGMWAAGAFAVKAVVDGLVRYLVARQRRASPAHVTEVAARLEQLSAAIEAIAIEQERQGELQRFAAQLAEGSRDAKEGVQ